MAHVMVETVDGVELADGDDFVKIDGDKKVGSATGGNPAVGNYTQSADNMGWEASFELAEGTYDLDVHTQVSDDGSQTSALAGRSAELTIDCPEESAPPSSAPPSSAPPSTAPPSTAPPSTAPPSTAPPSTAPPSTAPPTTPPPTGSVAPTQSTAPTPTQTPAGSVGGATGTPGTTLPPTDTIGDVSAAPGSDAWRLVLLALAGALAAALLLTPARAVRKDR